MTVSPDSKNPAAQPRTDDLPSLVDDDGSDDRPSITEVNGTVARFDMAYAPPSGERVAFGPPLSQRIPSLAYLALAVAVAAVVFYGQRAPSNSALYIWVVEGDLSRPITAAGISLVLLLSAVATVIRAWLRGVVVHTEGVEARELLPLGIPRVRRWAWPQIHRVVVSSDRIALELWDGAYVRLPPVADRDGLARTIVGIAHGRKIQVTHLG